MDTLTYMHKGDIFFGTALLGFVSGIFYSSVLPISLVIVLLLGVGAFVCICFKNSRALMLAVVLFGFVCGVGRMLVAQKGEHMIGFGAMSLTGVVENVTTTEGGVRFVMGEKDKTLVRTYQSEIHEGDSVRVQGLRITPKNFLTNQGSMFDYASYLYKDDITGVLDAERIEVIQHGKKGMLARLGAVSVYGDGLLQKLLPHEEAALASGILLGQKQSLSQDFRNELVTTSTIHIVALSGYNVTIVADALRAMVAEIPFMGVRGGQVFGALGILFFVLATGAQSSAIRAGVMALIALYSRTAGKVYHAGRALCAALFLMLLWNPKYLYFDVSFQLSFLATLGVLYLVPLFERLFVRVPKKILWFFPLRETLAVTCGAQTAVLPFLIYKTGVVSLVSVPVNILIVPMMPVVMGTTTLSLLSGMLHPLLAMPCTYITHILLMLVIKLIHFFAGLPYAAVLLQHIPLWICASAYVGMIWIVFVRQRVYSNEK